MISFRMSRPAQLVHGPRSGPLETSSHRRHHGAGHNEVPTPERTMSPVRHKTLPLWERPQLENIQTSDKGYYPQLDVSTFPIRHIVTRNRNPLMSRCSRAIVSHQHGKIRRIRYVTRTMSPHPWNRMS